MNMMIRRSAATLPPDPGRSKSPVVWWRAAATVASSTKHGRLPGLADLPAGQVWRCDVDPSRRA
jgi:hypothetical protein